ncbi:MAG: 6-phosphogluconolactonase [Chromatiales bacterium]|nr:6-phosphogluconolactonase [Chromatiales bacterium]
MAETAAERIMAAAERAIAERGRFRIVLAGGTTPRMTFEHLSRAESLWSEWEVYFGDERCLPAEHPERNSRMAQEALLGRVPIPAEHCFPIPAERGAEAAARSYAGVVDTARPFDLVMLGMGEDGHTASLFPGQMPVGDAAVVAVHDAPKPPSDRVSLSVSALADCRELLILVTGEGKHPAVSAWRTGEALPIAQVAGRDTAEVLIDRAAMGV